MWQHWINALLGLWVVVIAFLGLGGTTLMWTLVITGVVIAVLALWGSMGASSSSEQGERRSERRTQYQ